VFLGKKHHNQCLWTWFSVHL